MKEGATSGKHTGGKLSRELRGLMTQFEGLARGPSDEKRKKLARELLAVCSDKGWGSGEESGGEDKGDAGVDESEDHDTPLLKRKSGTKVKAKQLGEAEVPSGKGGVVQAATVEVAQTTVAGDVGHQLVTMMGALTANITGLTQRLSKLEFAVADAAERTPLREPFTVQPARRRETAPFGVYEDDDEDDSSAVREAKELLRSRLAEQEAKRTLKGKSKIRTDGLAVVDAMERLMAQPGGVIGSLEGTLVNMLHRFSLDHPDTYKQVKNFVKTGLKDRAQDYDLRRAEILRAGGSIFESEAMERTAQAVASHYLEIFAGNSAMKQQMKAVLRPEEDFVYQLAGSADTLALLYSRAKQVAYLGAKKTGLKADEGSGADSGEPGRGAGAKKK